MIWPAWGETQPHRSTELILHHSPSNELTAHHEPKLALSNNGQEPDAGSEQKLNIFQEQEAKIREAFANLNLDEMTPIEALTKLDEFKRLMKQGSEFLSYSSQIATCFTWILWPSQ